MKLAKVTLFVCTRDEADTMEKLMEVPGSTLRLHHESHIRQAVRTARTYREDELLPIFCTFDDSMLEEREILHQTARNNKAAHLGARMRVLLTRPGQQVTVINTVVAIH
jgi:hypothetical protein